MNADDRLYATLTIIITSAQINSVSNEWNNCNSNTDLAVRRLPETKRLSPPNNAEKRDGRDFAVIIVRSLLIVSAIIRVRQWTEEKSAVRIQSIGRDSRAHFYSAYGALASASHIIICLRPLPAPLRYFRFCPAKSDDSTGCCCCNDCQSGCASY